MKSHYELKYISHMGSIGWRQFNSIVRKNEI